MSPNILEFAGLHIDPLVIGEKNSKIQGPDIKRKNNCIVNTGGTLRPFVHLFKVFLSTLIIHSFNSLGKPSREEIKRRLQQNKQLYVT